MMKALSLTQPWAQLVAIGAKRIETRSWYAPHRGPIAIHASKGFPRDARELCVSPPFREALEKGGVAFKSSPPQHWYHVPEPYRMVSALPLGAIVAVANLVDCLPTAFTKIPEVRLLAEQAFGNFKHGRYAWWLLDVRRLPEPIPCKGALGLWTVPDEVVNQIEASR